VIRILLVDNHASFRQSLAFLLEGEPDMTVVGQAGTLAEARRMLHGVDVAVIEVDDLPDGNGRQLIKELHRVSPDSQVLGLVLPRCGGRVHAGQALEAGAACVLQKSVGIGDIIGAIRGLHAGRGRLA
jgi:DNA-binding NarL/FixJ family response regulator